MCCFTLRSKSLNQNDRGVKGKEVILLIMSVCLVGLQLDDSEWREQVSIILSSVNYLGDYFIL